MYRKICDICGKEIMSNDCSSQYKLKKYGVSWAEGWWTNLDVHDACWKEVCGVVKDRMGKK